jgi:hypothetical protein
MNHLLNTCPYNAKVWDHCATIMRTSDRKRDNISNTIEEWRDEAFQSPVLNRIWQLLPGFILWQLWKERNRRIFRNTQSNWHHGWTQICHNITETISLQQWSEADLICPTQEQSIMNNWKLNKNQSLLPPPRPSPRGDSPSHWSPPPLDFIKLNFDGPFSDGVIVETTCPAPYLSEQPGESHRGVNHVTDACLPLPPP